MIRITAKINIGDMDGGELTDITSSQSGNNISSPIIAVMGSHTQATPSPFILGKGLLGSDDCFAERVDYYIGSIVSDSDGIFPQSYVFDISGENITQLVIVFDKVHNEFPRSITVDGETYYDDDPQWEIKLVGASSHKIIISNWNTPSSPLVITSMYTDLSINIDESNLLSFEREIIDRSDVKVPSYGVISNNGRMSFIDIGGVVKEYAQQYLLQSGLKVIVSLNNTKTNAKSIIGQYSVSSSDYSIDTGVMTIGLQDNLIKLQDIKTENIYLYDKETLYDLFAVLRDLTIPLFEVTISNEFKEYLQSVKCPYLYLYADSLWNQWRKFCEACGGYLYIMPSNKITIKTDFRV